uniref:Uncharacterized protein n=1 Tax=Oryza rufipogon TaxID=4529 RepID=A0A0E0R7I3_ORYRU
MAAAVREFLKPKIAEPATISSAAAADRLRLPAETNVMCVVRQLVKTTTAVAVVLRRSGLALWQLTQAARARKRLKNDLCGKPVQACGRCRCRATNLTQNLCRDLRRRCRISARRRFGHPAFARGATDARHPLTRNAGRRLTQQ